MSTQQQRANRRRDEIEAWWALIARILSFFLGAGILLWQTVSEHTDRPYLIVAAIGLMGPAVAQAVAQVFASIRSGQAPGVDQ